MIAGSRAAAPASEPAGLGRVTLRRLPMEQKVLVASVVGLSAIGLPMVLAASDVLSIDSGQSPYVMLERQILFLAVGLVVAFLASRIPLRQLRRWNVLLFLAVLALLAAVLVPGVGQSAGGASRWIPAGPLQIQPSELMKIAIVLFASDMLARRSERKDYWAAMVRPLGIALVLAAGLILLQPDLGTAIVISCVVVVLLFTAGVPLRLLGVTFGAASVFAVAFALHAPYRRARLLSFVNPFAHAGGTGYQVVQSLSALGMGGMRGSGVGASAATWGYLPNAQTDFVFSVVGGNLGIAGSVAVIALFGAFAWAGLRVAYKQTDPFTRFVALGVTTWVTVQAVINVGGAVDALPVTGIPLPFVSYGGSALIVELAGAGLLYGIARRQGRASLLAVTTRKSQA
ncbi:MAG: putative lipid II flippase FtsW [Acidimicrobiales bacterium]